MDLTLAAAWTAYAAAAMGVAGPDENTDAAAKAADRMLAQFQRRFAWDEAADAWTRVPLVDAKKATRVPSDDETR